MRHKLAVIAGLLAASISTPAFASILYDFTATSSFSGPTGTFSYTSPNFIASDVTVNPGQLNSCTLSTGVCGNQTFQPNNSIAGGTYDLVLFTSGSLSNYYYFAAGSFGGVGTYNTTLLQGLQEGTLTVSNVASVPEPATWAMMLLGFGGIGMALRRSRRRRSALMQVA